MSREDFMKRSPKDLLAGSLDGAEPDVVPVATEPKLPKASPATGKRCEPGSCYVNFRLDKELRRRANTLAAKEGTTSSKIYERAIRSYLDQIDAEG